MLNMLNIAQNRMCDFRFFDLLMPPRLSVGYLASIVYASAKTTARAILAVACTGCSMLLMHTAQPPSLSAANHKLIC